METFDGITDEQFDALVTKLSEAPFHYKDEEKDEKKKKKKDDEEAKADSRPCNETEAKAELEEAAEAAEEAEDAETLNDAEVEDTAALAAISENDSQAVVSSLNDYFSEVLSGTSNKKES